MLEQNAILKIVRKARAALMPRIRPKRRYFLAPIRSLRPISAKHGFDRGTPVDRYYADRFLENNQADIRGRVLEVGNRYYTKKFGQDRVLVGDAVDIDPDNKRANITADLRKLEGVPDSRYDCFIMTFVIGMIDDYHSVLAQARRILKPGGVLLAVDSGSSPYNPDKDYWRFTPNSARLVFGAVFGPSRVEIKTYGNVLSGQYTWVGLAAEELKPAELDHHQPRYTTVFGVRAVKEQE